MNTYSYDTSEILDRLQRFRFMSEQEDAVDQLASVLMEGDFYEMLSEEDRQTMTDLLDEYDTNWESVFEIGNEFWALTHHRIEHYDSCILAGDRFYMAGFLFVLLWIAMPFGHRAIEEMAVVCFTVGVLVGLYLLDLTKQFLITRDTYIKALRTAPSFEEVVGRFMAITKCAR